MNRLILISFLLLVILLLFSQTALAVPTFQTYIDGATAGDYYGDQDTWFTTDSTFSLIVVGAYGPNTKSLTEGTLLLSVPDGETGTITISGGGGATLLYEREETAISGVFNPETDADIDLLTNEAGNSAGFDGYQTTNFLPSDYNFNSHYPLQDDVSDFLLYSISDFYNLGPVNNYNADNGGSITIGDGDGEEKVFDVTVTGFTWVHIDVYGYETIDNGKVLKNTWDINPGSHDSTYLIPAPGAILLGSIGVCLVGWLRRRRTL